MQFEDPIIIKHAGADVTLDFDCVYPGPNRQRFIQSWVDDEPWAIFTVGIPDIHLSENQTILDTNNEPELLGILIDAGIAHDTGSRAVGLHCEYPIVEFTEAFVSYLDRKRAG